ncbi:PREDICTED: zinc finger protein 432-like isoform X2 [Papilio xuthus]|uniref:Zinc finger protein 432-like isoform X2 n=1 Tax=Papilio xuthus TaxID=66420 RepID=A0AAJ7EIH4_PAPXU|nr:PREDICTED: zinc finger protein 432-like isoform X2 [Papilio xuthus]
MEPKLTNTASLKTYSRSKCWRVSNPKDIKSEPLTTKEAVKYLLQGSLKRRVCRFCLSATTSLSELDEILEVANSGTIFQVTIRDMVVSFYPFKISDDPNFPNKICGKCLDKTINCYLFTQQCERTERAIRNCFIDISEKFDKLDPIERVKKRGRQKLNPNHNIIHVEHKNVINYADPIINIVNAGSSLITNNNDVQINDLECPRCWQVFTNVESLVNHEKIHPKSMWYNCKLCGNSFVKHSHYKKHMKQFHGKESSKISTDKQPFRCNECGTVCEELDNYLQHIEKHKFKNVLEHLVEKKMDSLCGVCLDKGDTMTRLNETLSLHGGYPELSGEMTVATVLTATIPEMNTVHNYTGTKICEKCFNHALTSYIFISKIRYIRNRLNTCISLMLDNLNRIDKPENNVMVEISMQTILPITEKKSLDDEYMDDDVDESQLKIEVLEDEFRIESESSEESLKSENTDDEEIGTVLFDDLKKMLYPVNKERNDKIDGIKKEETEKIVNGYQDNEVLSPTDSDVEKSIISDSEKSPESDIEISPKANDIEKTLDKSPSDIEKSINDDFSILDNVKPPVNDICSEFLTFKKKPKPKRKYRRPYFTCPYCSKHFISDYFLKNHVLKHINTKINCSVCCMPVKSKFHLFEHMKMIHLPHQKEYNICDTCGRSFTDIKKFLLHKKTHMTKVCPLCDKLFRSQNTFDSHFQRHAGKFNVRKISRSQTCSFCEKEFTNENELSLHVNKSHLQIKPYSCDMCEKKFYTEQNLTSHKKLHGFRSKETCEFCSKIFKCRRDLVAHVRKHIGIKPHHCQICRESFYSETSQQNHMKVVHGGKYCCRLCKSVFNRKVDVKTHVNVAHNAM